MPNAVKSQYSSQYRILFIFQRFVFLIQRSRLLLQLIIFVLNKGGFESGIFSTCQDRLNQYDLEFLRNT